MERACLHLPDSKTGAKVVHLNAPALQVLAGIERVEGNPHVIAGEKPGAYFVGVQKAWQRLRAEAGLGDLRLHDLRHSFAAVLAGLGEGLPVIGKLLGHSQAVTTGRYAHVAVDPAKRAAERAGAALAGMINGDSAEVVQMPRWNRTESAG
jgi:integrase